MFTPQNEQGVVVIFAQLAASAGWQIVEIGVPFPDALLSKDGELWKTEFEFLASNFIDHKHDHRGCELIICWENDYQSCPIPILALSDSNWVTQAISKPDTNALAAEYWKTRALIAEKELSAVRGDLLSAKAENSRMSAQLPGLDNDYYIPLDVVLSRLGNGHREKLLKLLDIVENNRITGPADIVKVSDFNKTDAYTIWPIAQAARMVYLNGDGAYHPVKG